MDYTIEFGGTPQDVTVATSGTATVDGIKGYLEDLVSDPRYRPGMVILMDHTRLDVSSLTANDMRAIASFAVYLGNRLGNPLIAHVSPTPSAFGVTRMTRTYAEEAASRSRVFYTRDAALAWLEEEDAGPPS
jgi:hypothetical protein